MSKYTEQAEKFLKDTETKFSVKFVEYARHFVGDKEMRDIYEITLQRGERKFVFNFGQSINASGRFWKYGNSSRGVSNGFLPKGSKVWHKPVDSCTGMREWEVNKNWAEPTAYDVLACLTKNDPGTFEDFCNDFGYDTDSRTAEKTFKAVVNEWQNIAMLYTDKEIEALQEIN